MKKIIIATLLLFSSCWVFAGSPSLSGPSTSTGSITLTPNQPESPYFLNDFWKKAPNGSWEAYRVNYGSSSVTDSVGSAGIYQYRTRWYNPNSSSEYNRYSSWSNIVYVDVQIGSAPSPRPTISLASTDSDGTFYVSWSASSGASRYQLQRKIGSGSWSTQQNTSSRNKSYTSQANGSYSFRVRSCNSVGCTSYSPTKTIVVNKPTLSVPSAPSSVTFLPPPTNVVYWSSVSNATSYNMQYKSGSTWVTYHSGSGTGTTVGATGASYFRVQACNGDGCSGWRYSN
ncbi:chitinase N-terminal domain-containing protein [Teredinibacter purpureus]|uniref:chitinase N-terminal domain-containing protein n=1 Tax=Teredinibacter purpureus TaxID=2731756 RepID=UPI0013C53A97|nr:fibronectin type III domain-containing protein [Teredinibacter purpureus]